MITILLTTYNDAKLLPNTVKSIVSQKYKNFELLIIDDGSTDKTGLIVEKFNDQRIRYIKIDHRGRSGALNYGLKLAKYDWVFLIDADDLILPETLDKYSKYITYPHNTVISSFACFYERKRIIFYLNYPTKDNEVKKFIHLHSINNTVLFNRNFILHSLKGYDVSIIDSEEDYELWLRAYDQISFIIIPEYLVVKGFRYDSFSMRTSVLKREKVYLLQRNFYNRMNISSINQDYELLGWRELFYGNKSEARKTFYKLGFRILKKQKIFLAIFLSNLPDKLLSRILLFNYYPRILYRLKYFSDSFVIIRKYFKKVM